MITIHTVTIIEKTRADYRRTLTELFLSEAPGAAGTTSKIITALPNMRLM